MEAKEIFGPELGTIPPLLAELARYAPEQFMTLGGVFAKSLIEDQAAREAYCSKNFSRHAPVWRKDRWVCLDSPRLPPRPIRKEEYKGEEEKKSWKVEHIGILDSGCCQLPSELKTYQDFADLIQLIIENPSFRLLVNFQQLGPYGPVNYTVEIDAPKSKTRIIYNTELSTSIEPLRDPVNYIWKLNVEQKLKDLYAYQENPDFKIPLFLYRATNHIMKLVTLESVPVSELKQFSPTTLWSLEWNEPSSQIHVLWALELNKPDSEVWNAIWEYLDYLAKKIDFTENRLGAFRIPTSYESSKLFQVAILRLIKILIAYERTDILRNLDSRIHQRYEERLQRTIEEIEKLREEQREKQEAEEKKQREK